MMRPGCVASEDSDLFIVDLAPTDALGGYLIVKRGRLLFGLQGRFVFFVGISGLRG
jgi:hypothetical protein